MNDLYGDEIDFYCPECGAREGTPCSTDCKCLDCNWGNGA